MPKNSFQPGNQAAKGHGRPTKTEGSLTELLRMKLDTKDPKKRREYKQLVIDKIMELALKGDKDMLKYLYNRLEGMPHQSTSVDGDMNVTVTIESDLSE